MRQRASARGRRTRRRPAERAEAPPAPERIGLAEELGLVLPADLPPDVPPDAGSDLPPDDELAEPAVEPVAEAGVGGEAGEDVEPEDPVNHQPAAARRTGRTSVPRWEDVMLGTRTSAE
jgi:hypothetical protein